MQTILRGAKDNAQPSLAQSFAAALEERSATRGGEHGVPKDQPDELAGDIGRKVGL